MNSKNLAGVAFSRRGIFVVHEYIEPRQTITRLGGHLFTHPWTVCRELQARVML